MNVEVSKLATALAAFHRRDQFHNSRLLDAIIEAVREEERAKFPALVAMAKAIAIQGLREESK
jgi:hypothetical protein